MAEPEWVAKVARGETPRRCLACNTCINEMRGGARIGCVVNAMAGREREFAGRAAGKGRRIAVIGAGPAGLTYAALVAGGNSVTLFEREAVPGGSFRLAGLAPLFQEVEANPEAFSRTIAALAQACAEKGVALRYSTDVLAAPELLAPFDRIVIAAGADYRFGLGFWARAFLASGSRAKSRWHRCSPRRAFATGSITAPVPPRRIASAAWRAPARTSSRSATRRSPARARRRSHRPSRRRSLESKRAYRPTTRLIAIKSAPVGAGDEVQAERGFLRVLPAGGGRKRA